MPELKLNDFTREMNKNTVTVDWWGTECEIPLIIGLICAKLKDAIDEYHSDKQHFDSIDDHPEKDATEFAGAIIRICDRVKRQGWELDMEIREKHEHNKTRPYRHNGKRV